MTVSLEANLLAETPGLADTGRRPLTIAVLRDSPFADSIIASGHRFLPLPDLPDTGFNRPMPRRIEDGEIYREFFRNNDVDLLFDWETASMTFVPDPGCGANAYAMTHTLFDIPYVSHFVDPITETMKQTDWGTRWCLLEHPGWIKWVWDDAHARELQRLGAANVFSMPMATGNDDVYLDPLPEHPPGAAIAFIGHPATSWFTTPSASPDSMRAGMIAAAAKADDATLTFQDIYFDLYGFAEPPHSAESGTERAKKAAAYFEAKFMYNVFLAVKQRDRFVLFLRRKLGEQFELIGDYWPECVGVEHKPRIWERSDLLNAYRNVAICLNLYKGNAETGLNLRQFEVTAAGGFLLTYRMAELADHFDIGSECVVFDDERDLLDKIRYYLAHPAERIEIALAGQRRTLNEHLYSHRIGQLLKRIGLGRPAPCPGGRQNTSQAPSGVTAP